tara:strand:+ start:4402 stop:5892 length:1491 start_codon:yes stop_codon:yes gene_type:complete
MSSSAMTASDSSSDSSVSSGKIPDLIKIGAIDSTTEQILTTGIIDAVTISQERARFTLQRVSGFLHSNSKITLGVIPGVARSFYPLQIGVSNLIKSATLTIGNSQVCHVDDYSNFHSYQSIFMTNENNKEREQYLSQRCMSHAPVYDDRTGAAVGDDLTPNGASKLGLDVGRNPVIPAAGGAGVHQLLPFQINDNTSAQTIADAPVYSVYLSDLFPFLKSNQLPCQLIDEEIHIDITFQDSLSSLGGAGFSRRMCVAATLADTTDFQIDTNECKLIYDSISYDGETMRKYAEQNKTLNFQYVDYRLAKRTGDETAFSDLTFQLGGNGRLVSKVMFALSDNRNMVPQSLLSGVVSKSSANDNNLSVNLLYNDLYEYNRDRSNPALLFHTTQQAEGMVPQVTKDEWKVGGSTVGGGIRNAITDETMEGHIQSSADVGLTSNFQWVAIRPNKGQRVNNKGMDLIYKNPNLDAGSYTLRVYLELLKVATIENGKFSCYFA